MVATAAALAAIALGLLVSFALIVVGVGQVAAPIYAKFLRVHPGGVLNWAARHLWVSALYSMLAVSALAAFFVFLRSERTDTGLSWAGLSAAFLFASLSLGVIYTCTAYDWPSGKSNAWKVGRALRRGAAVGVGTAILLAWVAAGQIWDASARQGYALLHNKPEYYSPGLDDWLGFVRGQVSVRPIKRGDDPLDICMRGAGVINLGLKDDVSWVVVLPVHGPGRVLALPRERYQVWTTGAETDYVCGSPTR